MQTELVINLELQTGHYDLCGSGRKRSSVRVTAVMINLKSLVTRRNSEGSTRCIDHHTVSFDLFEIGELTILHKDTCNITRGQRSGFYNRM